MQSLFVTLVLQCSHCEKGSFLPHEGAITVLRNMSGCVNGTKLLGLMMNLQFYFIWRLWFHSSNSFSGLYLADHRQNQVIEYCAE